MKFAGYFSIVVAVLIVSVMGCKKEPIDHACDHIITDTIYDTVYVSNIAGPITFDDHIAEITNNYCITCHGGSSPSGGFVLTSYSAVRNAAENGQMLIKINDEENPMPPTGLLSELNRNLIQRWVDDGYLEN